MKKSLLLLATTLFFAGCGDEKKPETPPPAPLTTTSNDTGAGAIADIKQAGKDIYEQNLEQVKETVNEAKSQAKEIAAAAKEQGKTAASEVKTQADGAIAQGKNTIADLKNSLKNPTPAANGTDLQKTLASAVTIEAVQAKTGDFVSQITSQVSQLSSANDTSPDLKNLLAQLASNVTDGNDTSAIGTLGKIIALKPTDAQMKLIGEMRDNVAVLALGRNFDAADANATGAINQTIAAIQSKDVSKIISGLDDIGTKVSPTTAQKDLLGNMLGTYAPAVSDTVKKASSLLDTAKGFGL